MSYRVQYNNMESFLTTNVERTVTLTEIKKYGYKVDFKTKKEAETALKSRANKLLVSEDYYKVIKVEKENMVSTEDLVEKLLIAVTAEYGRDTPAPGIVFSKLKNGEIYGSVCRYNQPGYNTGDKTVIASAKATTVRGMVTALSQEWLGKGAAKDSLARALRGY